MRFFLHTLNLGRDLRVDLRQRTNHVLVDKSVRHCIRKVSRIVLLLIWVVDIHLPFLERLHLLD